MRSVPPRWSKRRQALVGLVVGVLVFTGAPLAAWSAPTPDPSATPTPTDTSSSDTSAGKVSAQDESVTDDAATPSDDATTSESASPSADDEPTAKDEESATPEESETPSDEASESASPSATPSRTPGGRVTVQAVPPATGNNAVISVKVGGTRTGLTQVSDLQGVVLGFYTTETGGTLFDQCTSDADGDCFITVPNTGGTNQNPQANRDRQFWVRQISAPGTHYTNPELGTGTTVAPDPYRFQTCPQLRAGVQCLSSQTGNNGFMLSTGTTNNEASSGIWQNSLDNPVFPARCGIRVALVLDLSNSVTDPQLVQLKGAATTFVDSLAGTPSSVGTFTFATSAPATAGDTLALTPVSTAAGATTVKNKINGYNKPGGQEGGTNWDRGLYQVAQSTSTFDVAVVITDGNPTFYGAGEGPGNRTRFREVENGIFSANAIKAENTKVLAVGVGDGVGNDGSGENLRSISGELENTDYYQTDDYAAAGAALRALALGNCEGSITVVKQVVPAGAPANSTAGATPQGGWTFTGTGSTDITFDSPNARVTATGTGGANFPLTFSGGTTTGPVTLNETLQAGYTLHTINGNNATCTRVDTGAGVTATNSGATGFTVTAASTYPVSCTVYNAPPQPLATVVLNKNWVINGGAPIPDGQQPAALIASGLLNGNSVPWGQVQSGFRQGDSVTLNETTSLVAAPLCRLTSSRLTNANGTTVDLGLPNSQTLATGANTYTITNTVTCDTRLRLTKTVDGGINPPPASDWTLTAVPPSGALPGPTGTTGVNASVTPGVRYPLSENTPHPEYVQSVAANAVLIPGASGSWNCQQVEADGTTVIPGFSDGLNGGVTVPFGTYVRCNAVNQTATLGLIKEVYNDNGGTAVPSNWNLVATPTGTFPADLPTVTQPGVDAANVVYVNVRPDTGYVLTETPNNIEGYRLATIQCQIDRGQRAPVADNTVILSPGFTGTCWFTNEDQPAQLSLVKHVVNGTTGGTLGPENFALTATGPTTISGPGNSPAVTDRQVLPGDYALSEVTSAGYTASAWTCTGGTLTGTSVNVPLGGDVTCEITNTAQQAQLTLVKTIDNDSGGDAEATDWTLTANGPTTGISGATGATAVTNVAVLPGTYGLSESGPDGYTASDWTCTGGGVQNGPSIQVRLGEDVTCTINNDDDQAHLTLIKTVTNDNGGTAIASAWTLSAAGPTTISGITNAPAVTNAEVDPGDYTLSENGPTGYASGEWSCNGGDQDGPDLTISLGDDITCRINNNDEPARLTLIKEVDNGDTGAGAEPGDWTLTAAGATTVSGTGDSDDIVNQVVDAGDYVLSESGGPDGYTNEGWDCGDAVLSGSTVTVPNGGNVTCTIVNTAEPVTLTLVKLVEPGVSGDTTPTTAWTLTAVNGASIISGATGSTAVTSAAAIVGTYNLSESTIPGWNASDWVCTGATATDDTSVTLELGDDATCTITNTAVAPRLTLVKEVENNYGGQAGPADWTLTATGDPAQITGPGNSPAVTNQTVPVGDYVLSESGGPGGYTAGDWDCGDADLEGSTLSLPLGANVTCTITNSDQPATLTLVKVISDDVPTDHVPADFTLTADPQDIEGQDPVTGPGNSPQVTSQTVFAGDYELSESGPSGFLGSVWECTGGVVAEGVVTVPNGGNVTCTITNTAIAPHLTLVKQIDDPNQYGTAEPTDWTLTADGPSPISGTTGAPAVTDATVEVGSYTLSESGPADYTASAWTCVDAENQPVTVTRARVTLAEGDDITCTITNTPVPPSWSILKLSDPPSGDTVEPGDEITYGVFLIRNEGVDPTDVVVNDDLSQVLNNATLVDGPTTCGDADCTVDYGTASITGTTLTWNVPVLDQPIAYVQYTVRVNDDAFGVTLENHATSPGSSPCVPDEAADLAGNRFASQALATGPTAFAAGSVTAAAADDELCPDHTDHYTPAWSLEKTSDPESGSEVDPGDQVTYTLTATNTTDNAVLEGAVATDDLSDVLQYASLDSVPSGATLSGDILTWDIPTLEPGESATLTYTVTVDDDAYDVEFGNVATPGDGGTCTNSCSTTHHTPGEPGEHLPNTGGTSLVPVGLGFGFLLAGGLVLHEARRRRLAKAPVRIDPDR